MALEDGDRWLLCSDGLFGVVTDEAIQEVLAAAGPLEALCQRLVDEANQAGGPDNVTALLLQVDGQ